jgi:hypothetical protein
MTVRAIHLGADADPNVPTPEGVSALKDSFDAAVKQR